MILHMSEPNCYRHSCNSVAYRGMARLKPLRVTKFTGVDQSNYKVSTNCSHACGKCAMLRFQVRAAAARSPAQVQPFQKHWQQCHSCASCHSQQCAWPIQVRICLQAPQCATGRHRDEVHWLQTNQCPHCKGLEWDVHDWGGKVDKPGRQQRRHLWSQDILRICYTVILHVG